METVMHRFVIAFVGVACFSVATSTAYAQSGSRSPIGGGGSSSGASSGGGGGGGSAGGSSSSGRFSNVRSQYRTGVTLAERAALQRAQFALNQSQSDAARALAEKNLQASRKAFYDGQVAKQSRRTTSLNQQEQDVADLRQRNLEKRKQHELAKAEKIANMRIHWPHALQRSDYAERLKEIEAFAKLHARLRENDGIKAGFHVAVRGLALQILQDEREGTLNNSDSKEVKVFVRALNKNYGQFPSIMKQSMDDEGMLASKM